MGANITLSQPRVWGLDSKGKQLLPGVGDSCEASLESGFRGSLCSRKFKKWSVAGAGVGNEEKDSCVCECVVK